MMAQKRAWTPLSEKERIDILVLRSHGLSAYDIAERIGPHGRSVKTVQSFLSSYTEKQQLFPKRGRPSKKTPDRIVRIVQATGDEPRSSVRYIAEQETVSRELVRQIRHENKIHYYASVPVPPLDDAARQARVKFCRTELGRLDRLPIVFTDESSIRQDLNKGGIWRKKGQFVVDGFYEQEGHPVSVMVWGGITQGFRLPLLKCPESVTAVSYLEMLAQGHVLYRLIQHFGGNDRFRFQQDNAPPHQPTFAIFRGQRYEVLEWPANSPDLSPIEMLWAIIKKKLQGRRFADQDDLFAGIRQCWDDISQETIDSLIGSFYSRCQVCLNHGGASLNGHWREVHALHHPQEDAEFEDE